MADIDRFSAELKTRRVDHEQQRMQWQSSNLPDTTFVWSVLLLPKHATHFFFSLDGAYDGAATLPELPARESFEDLSDDDVRAEVDRVLAL